jgi:hypothetical protein
MNIQVFVGGDENSRRAEKPIAAKSESNSQSPRYKPNQGQPRNLIYSGLAAIVVLIFRPRNLMREKPIFRMKDQTNSVSPKTGD